MVRSPGILVLAAVLSAPLVAHAQSFRAERTSQERVAKYFSNVPIGVPGHEAQDAPSAWAPWMPRYPVGMAYQPAPSPLLDPERLEDIPPSRLPGVLPLPSAPPASEPGTTPPTKAPAELPGASKPTRAAPPTAGADPTTPAAKPTPKPTATEEKVPALPLPADPAYAPPKTPSQEPARTPPPDETWSTEEGQVVASDEGCSPCAAQCGACYACEGAWPVWRRWLDPGLSVLGIQAGGWIDFGGTVNAFSPRNRSNLPVTFNDRSNDVQMNQLYAFLEQPIDWDDDSLQVGGRVDLLYGTDHVYTTSRGLETFRNGLPKWNSDNGPVGTNYGLAMPQAYLEAFAPLAEGLSVKMGHFYTIMGYESVMAPDNFFYSHSYAHQYGEPFTHTGLLAAWQVSKQVKLQAGFTRGWDTWEDNNNDLGFLGGIQWTSEDGRTSLALTVHTGPEADEPPQRGNFRTTYSLVFNHKLTDRLTYVLQHDYGYEPQATLGRATGNWYGINQYVLYKINNCWSMGGRFEWFHDKSGFRTGPLDGADYYEMTLGLNWTPRERLLIRPEVRWDWADSSVRPFGDHTLDHQILVAVDAVVRF